MLQRRLGGVVMLRSMLIASNFVIAAQAPHSWADIRDGNIVSSSSVSRCARKREGSRRQMVSFGWVPLLFLLPLAACSQDVQSYRYKIQVDAECDGVPASGSSVVSVTWRDTGSQMAYPFNSRIEGEAVPIKLCDDLGYVFGLLGGVGSGHGNVSYFDASGTPVAVVNGFPSFAALRLHNIDMKLDWAAIARVAELPFKVELDASQYPFFVRFENLDVPSSVEQVQMDSGVDGFGGRVVVRRVSINSTDEPVSRQLADLLPWLAPLSESKNNTLSGSVATSVGGPLAGRLNKSSFTN